MKNARSSGLMLTVAIAACGDPVAYSEPISLELGAVKADDLASGAYSEDKSVSSEQGDPYKKFIANAKAALGGVDPGRVSVEKITLTVGSSSKNVGADGLALGLKTIEVFLADEQTTVAVGALAEVPKGTSVEVPVTATESTLAPLRGSLLGGSFKVGIRGDAATAPPSGLELRVNAQLLFAAHE